MKNFRFIFIFTNMDRLFKISKVLHFNDLSQYL